MDESGRGFAMNMGVQRSVRSGACAAALLAGALQLGACSALKPGRQLDAAPFAENTVSMAGEVQRYNRPPEWVYLSEFQGRPSVETVRKTARSLRTLFRSIALYSVQVVALHESRLGDARRVAELAGYIDEVARPGVLSGSTASIGVTQEEYEAILAHIRSRETLREALGAAQPLVTAVTTCAGALFDRADEEVAAAGEDLRAQVEQEFGPLLENLHGLEGTQARIVKAFDLLYEVRLGRESAARELSEVDPDVRALLPGSGAPAAHDLDLVEERLTTQLAHIRTVREQLEPEFHLYEAHLRELDALRTQTEEMLRVGRLALTVWSRSHRNLAAGIPIPPDIDLVGLLSRAAQVGKSIL